MRGLTEHKKHNWQQLEYSKHVSEHQQDLVKQGKNNFQQPELIKCSSE